MTPALEADARKAVSGALHFLSTVNFHEFAKAWEAQSTVSKVAEGESTLEAMLKIGSAFIPQLAVAEMGIGVAAAIIELSIQLSPEMIPDGEGGYVPKHGWPILDANGYFTGEYSL